MLYLIFEVYDDFRSFGKSPIVLKRKEEDAITFCKTLNSEKGYRWIDDSELKENPCERSCGYFYESIEIKE